ncbi:serine hydrolase domain-containing protein [Flagellimonas crocea]|uniref:serine hydrolase domain-containing protein n=1 Tax=Flagellimonas crocea TaxID=3067311 RepID=UPI00296F745D|nr:serine hydrolase domain-containing protein [Muricauda sp. DH64]
MRTRIKKGSTYLLLVFLLVGAIACSSSDSETPVDPNPIGNPDPTPDPDPNTPETQEDISEVDDNVTDFMQLYEVPGASLAVSVNEKMVYSKGYGKANVENDIDVSPNHLFRIASISKVFTATAILSLVDDGQLSLDDHVFGEDGLLGEDFGTAVLTADELNITVDHLLLHASGGWGTSTGGDPIDYQPALGPMDFISYVLENWTLSHAPGEAFSYSNTGYWLLARITEQVSGQTYEDYITDLLTPIGISTFKTTTFREDDLETDEVYYYGMGTDANYIFTIASRRDGDGGVVISAPDLLRFLCAIDGSSGRPDILSANSIQLLSETTELSNLGRGLAVWAEQGVRYFTGSLPGNRSWMMISNNGHTATILLNLRRTDTAQFDNDLQSLLLDIVNNGNIPWQTDLNQF